MNIVFKLLKKTTAVMTVCAMLLPNISVNAAKEDIKVLMMLGRSKAYINGENRLLDSESEKVTPVKKENTILVPIRPVAEALQATVEFDSETNEVVVYGNDRVLRMSVGSNKFNADGNIIDLSTDVQVIYNRTMVPVQPFAEGLGYKAFWNKNGIILIGGQQLNPNNEKQFIDDTVFNVYGEKYWTYEFAKDYVSLEELRAKLTFENVNKEMVKEKIKEKNTINIHPNYITTANDIEKMKKLIESKDSFITPLYQQLIKNADNVIASGYKPTYQLDDAKLRVADMHGYASTSLPELGLAYQLTGDKKYAKKAWEFMETFAGFEDWGAGRHFLDVGVGTTYIALAYDLIYDTLTKQQKTLIQDAVMQKALIPGMEGMKKGEFWASSGQNWNGICHTGLRLGAYMDYEKNPELCSEIISMAINNEKYYIKSFEPAGQTEEGQSYFDYGFSFAEIGFETDINIMGTEFGLTNTNGLKNAGWFPLRTSGTSAGVSVGDDDLKYTPNSSRIWFAKRYSDIPLAKLIFEQVIREKRYDWRTLVFYDPDLYDKAMNVANVSMPQLDNYVPDAEMISFRSNWSTKGNFISIHAGRNNAAHGHLDAGQVDIQAGGVYWVMGSLGRDNYQIPGYFDATRPGYNDAKVPQTVPGRNHIYSIRTEGKTAVVINSDGQPDTRQEQDDNGVPVVEKIVSKPRGGYSIINLTSPYNRDVSEYKRGIMLSNDRQVMTIQDEIVTKNDSAKVWWLLNTPAQYKLDESGKSAILEMGGQKMLMSVASPSNAVLKEIPITYLPGEEFPLTKNTPSRFKKLAIELSNVAKVTISVNFIPLTAGQLETDIKPVLKPMSKWTIEDGPLVETVNPKLDSLKVDGKPFEGFQPDFYSYSYISDLAVDSSEMPAIEALSENDVSVEKSEDTISIKVTDKTKPDNKSRYEIHIKKMGKPQQAQPLKIANITASETPEANHTPNLVIDGSLDDESRWSANGNQWLELDLGTEKEVSYLGMLVLKGYERSQVFSVSTSNDKLKWKTVFSGRSSGNNENVELYTLEKSTARYVRVDFSGNNINTWNSIVEIMLYGQ